MKKVLLGLLFLVGCTSNEKTHDLLISTDGKCVIAPKVKFIGNSVNTNLDAFTDSYGNKILISSGKITVTINDNRWDAAAAELKINLSECGKIR